MKEEGQLGDCSQTIPNPQGYQDQLLLQQQEIAMQPPPPPQSCSDMFGSAGRGSSSSSSGLIFPPDPSQLLPWTMPPVHSFNPSPSHHFPQNHESPFFIPPPPPITPSHYGSLFNRRGPPLQHQFPYDGSSGDHHHHLRILSDAIGPLTGSGPFGLQAELGKMTAQEILDAKALAASKSHSEAERRRRERINNHLARLRSLLPSTTKTDKASLLAEVIHHVKELKRQTSIIAETTPIPTETDELQVDTADEDGNFVIKASLCCEDRSDLLPELIKTLKALRLRTLKAEITTLGGRVKNVLLVTGEDQLLHDHPSSSSTKNNAGEKQPLQYSIGSIQEALKGVMERAGGDDTSSGSVKRQRTNVNSNMLEQQQQVQQQQLNRSL